MQGIEVREAGPDEYEAAGRLVVEAYRTLLVPPTPGYEAEIADVAGRTRDGTVLVALVDGRLAGCATFAVAGSPLIEVDDPDGATIRMLGVDVRMRGRGVGEALVMACVEHARNADARRVWLHTEVGMSAAHRLYERCGFTRVPAADLSFVYEGMQVTLLACVLELGA
jgi:ribosomal protein S18 acetylase RimI-like enzyme